MIVAVVAAAVSVAVAAAVVAVVVSAAVAVALAAVVAVSVETANALRGTPAGKPRWLYQEGVGNVSTLFFLPAVGTVAAVFDFML